MDSPPSTTKPPAVQPTGQAAASAPPGRSLWSDAARRIRRDRSAIICLLIIALYALIALGGYAHDLAAARHEAPAFSEMSDKGRINQGPAFGRDWRYWLGGDWDGKPILVKALLGAKVSMTVGFMANVIAVPLGMLLGAIAGYYGRWRDGVIVWLFSTLASIPGIILLIALKYAFQGVTILGLDLSGIHGLYLALGIMSWIGTCRLVRAETMKIRELDYVAAARAVGRSDFIILLRHVMPNVMHLGLISFSLGFVGAVQAEVILSYLGLGVEVGVPSWGRMINAARGDLISGGGTELATAVTAMFLLVLALNIFGDRLRDALDPRLRNV